MSIDLTTTQAAQWAQRIVGVHRAMVAAKAMGSEANRVAGLENGWHRVAAFIHYHASMRVESDITALEDAVWCDMCHKTHGMTDLSGERAAQLGERIAREHLTAKPGPADGAPQSNLTGSLVAVARRSPADVRAVVDQVLARIACGEVPLAETEEDSEALARVIDLVWAHLEHGGVEA